MHEAFEIGRGICEASEGIKKKGKQNMKDFQLRNDTKLLFCNDPVHDLADLTRGRNVLFVYGGGSVKNNDRYADLKDACTANDAVLFEAPGSSCEKTAIEAGIRLAKDNEIDLVIGAGGAV